MDPDVDYSAFRTDDDILRAEGGQDLVDEYHTARTDAGRDLLDFVLASGGQVVLDLIGWTDAKNCFTQGDIGACLWTAVNALGPLKLLSAALKLPEIGSAVVRIVGGLGRFRAAVAAGKRTVDRLRGVVDDIFQRVRNPCATNSFVAGTPVVMADGSRKPIEAVRAVTACSPPTR